MSILKRLIAELLGTFILVYFGPGAIAITLMLNEGATLTNPFNVGIGGLGGLAEWFAIGMAFGLSAAAAIYAFGKVSGPHLNPAVTIALWATKRFPTRNVGPYVAAQLIGASIASFAFAACLGRDAVTVGRLGATSPFPGISYGQAILTEIVGTFVLMLVIMGVAIDKKRTNGLAGLIIGLTIGGIITTIGNVSGSSLNPARTFGPYLGDYVLGGINLWHFLPIYIIGPIIGALIAAFLHDYLYETPDTATQP
jgi:glycerol uptake facilitator protein